jgi:short-subunit dehydrogenase
MEVNYYGCVDCTHFALPYLKKSTHAKILVISSLAGKGGVPHRSGYCASKFALHGAWPLHLRAHDMLSNRLACNEGFYDTLRQELSPKYPIGVTLVCPGFVRTNINATRLGPNPTTFDLGKAMPVDVRLSRLVWIHVAVLVF